MKRSNRKRHRPEEVVAKLRQADEAMAKGTPIAEVARSLGVSIIRVEVHILLAPAEVRGVRDPQQLAHRRHRGPPGEFDVRLPQLVDDLLCLESLAWHDLAS